MTINRTLIHTPVGVSHTVIGAALKARRRRPRREHGGSVLPGETGRPCLETGVGRVRVKGSSGGGRGPLVEVDDESPHLLQGVSLHEDVVLGQEERGDLGQLAHRRAVRVRDDAPELVQRVVEVVHPAPLPGVDVQPHCLRAADTHRLESALDAVVASVRISGPDFALHLATHALDGGVVLADQRQLLVVVEDVLPLLVQTRPWTFRRPVPAARHRHSTGVRRLAATVADIGGQP